MYPFKSLSAEPRSPWHFLTLKGGGTCPKSLCHFVHFHDTHAVQIVKIFLYVQQAKKTSIYITCICPHLEYAAQLWDPHVKRDVQMLESVQKFACKVCLKCWDMDYDNMLHCLDLPPLRVRRQHLKVAVQPWVVRAHRYYVVSTL